MNLPALGPSDETLVARVQRHDVTAFTTIYDRYATSVYTLAVHMLGSVEAEEIVQDVFLQLWHKADQFDANRGTFAGWFMTIARHQTLDKLRNRTQQQRIMIAEEIGQMIDNIVDSSVNIEEEAWLHERGAAVHLALKTLPQEQRQALLLAYFGGLSHSAIAEHLGWPLGTVKKRIQLGLQKLRAALIQKEIVGSTNRTTETDVK